MSRRFRIFFKGEGPVGVSMAASVSSNTGDRIIFANSREKNSVPSEDGCPRAVIPAQAGIHNTLNLQNWIPDKSTRE